jgi:16S rRNA A1518/A1519 N6-dimethyltransferase RsmA/KsgA/DIM1 with predicted DNA glycosylase/AP lyase activity
MRVDAPAGRAGTGKLTRLLVHRFSRLVAIEPANAMRRLLRVDRLADYRLSQRRDAKKAISYSEIWWT